MGVETIAAASLVIGAVGAAAGVAGGIQSSNAASKTASYQAQVAANNATQANVNANAAVRAGEARAEAQGIKNRASQGLIRAAIGANSLDVNSGSPVDVLESQRETGQGDVETIRHNAFMQAYGYQTQGAGFQSQAQLDRASAANDTALEPLTAAGGLASGASSLGSKWTSFKQSGALGGGTNPDDPLIT